MLLLSDLLPSSKKFVSSRHLNVLIKATLDTFAAGLHQVHFLRDEPTRKGGDQICKTLNLSEAHFSLSGAPCR